MGYSIGLFSAKGGAGKSLIAVNLGIACVSFFPTGTLVLDLTQGLNSVDLLLDVRPEHTWKDLIPVIPELLPEHFSIATEVHQSGLNLLAGPEELGTQNCLDDSNLEKLIAACNGLFRLTIVDCPTGMDGLAGSALKYVDLILIVVMADPISLRNTSRLLKSCKNKEKVRLVVNQYEINAPVSLKEIEDYLGVKLFAALPIAPKEVWENISYGTPFVNKYKKGIAEDIRNMARRIAIKLNKD